MKEILIDSEICEDYWGDGSVVCAKKIRESLGNFPEDEKELRITVDSPGGDVFEGITIFNIIRDFARAHPNVRITTYIQGMAASMAGVIALAANSVDGGNEIICENNSVFMIHNAWGVAIGNANDMRDAADWFSRVDGLIRAVYMRKTGKGEKEIRAMMDAETGLFGGEILAAGFCDRVIESEDAGGREETVKDSVSKFNAARNFVRESAVKAKKKVDWRAAASLAGLPPVRDMGKTAGEPAVNDKTDCTSNRAENEEGGCMTAEEFKKSNPEAYAQIVAEGEKAGVEKEQARASRLLAMGEKAGCRDYALECIRNGANPSDAAVIDEFMDKGASARVLQNQIAEQEGIPALNNLPRNGISDMDEINDSFSRSMIGG